MNYSASLWSFLLIAIITSCSASKKNTVYLSDLDPNISYPVKQGEEQVIRKDDRLRITVSSETPELAIPFNLKEGERIRVGEGGEISSSRSQLSGTTEQKGYLVDKDGNIDFPVLGSIHAEGLTLDQLKTMIREKIVKGNYISDPIVTTEISNFRVLVLGEVNKKGILHVDEDRINLLEAIILSGDVTEKGRADRVAVIRETGGKREIHWHDLGSRSVFDSPTFYLEQNDIVYVQPQPVKKEGVNKTLTYTSYALSAVLAIITTIALLKK